LDRPVTLVTFRVKRKLLNGEKTARGPWFMSLGLPFPGTQTGRSNLQIAAGSKPN
jgi:hypothetical protein